MYTVFLIGGIGSGKSTAALHLARRGAAVLDLDGLSREAVGRPEVISRLRERFGEGVIAPGGGLDRAALAHAAFADPASTRDLDDITHPVILGLLDERLDGLSRAPGAPGLVVVEVQVAEAMGPSGRRDEVVALRCPAQVRRARALSRGMDGGDFDARDAAQVDDDARCAMADFVVDASGSEGSVERALDGWLRSREQSGWVSPASVDAAGTREPRPGWLLREQARTGLPSPAIAFVGRHNSGKTTLVTRVISDLAARGADVGSVKHHGHVGFDIDVPGKDSWRHRQAGASEVAVSSPDRFALIRDLDGEMPMEQVVSCMRPHDVVVVEGYRHSDMPAVEVMRAASPRDREAARAFCASVEEGGPLAFSDAQFAPGSGVDARRMPDGHTVAVATDMPAVRHAAVRAGLVALDVNDPSSVAAFVSRGLGTDARAGRSRCIVREA